MRERTEYEPFQSGYQQAGTRYMEMPLSGDCRLGTYINGFFEVYRPKTDQILHIIPDGCKDLILAFDGNRVFSHISPSIPEPYQFRFQKMEWIFGVRFLPGATYPFFRDILRYDSAQAIDADLVLSNISEMEGPLCESGSFARRYEIVTAYLERKLCGSYDGTETLLRYCVGQILGGGGMGSVRALSQDTGYSDRYLRQLFSQHVGHSPKELSGIVRVPKALRYLERFPHAPLAQVALRFGFSDQSHMNRDFNRYLHLTSGIVKEDRDWLIRLQAGGTRSF